MYTKYMTKKYKIKKQDYFSKDEIQIEVEEEIVTPVEVKKTYISVSNIKDTIAFLKEKKKKNVAEIEAEINENQEILDLMKSKIDAVEIQPLPPVTIEN